MPRFCFVLFNTFLSALRAGFPGQVSSVDVGVWAVSARSSSP